MKSINKLIYLVMIQFAVTLFMIVNVFFIGERAEKANRSVSVGERFTLEDMIVFQTFWDHDSLCFRFSPQGLRLFYEQQGLSELTPFARLIDNGKFYCDD